MDQESKSKSNDKIQLLRELHQIELTGVNFTKYYTILDDIEELKCAVEHGKHIQNQMNMEYKVKQFAKLVGLVLKAINPEEAAKSPVNPDNWESISKLK